MNSCVNTAADENVTDSLIRQQNKQSVLSRDISEKLQIELERGVLHKQIFKMFKLLALLAVLNAACANTIAEVRRPNVIIMHTKNLVIEFRLLFVQIFDESLIDNAALERSGNPREPKRQRKLHAKH